MYFRGMLQWIAALALGSMVCCAQQKSLPPPYATRSANNPPEVIPRPAGARLSTPSGFQMEILQEGFRQPRFMLLGPSNEILLADSAPANGAIYVLNGKERRPVVENLHRPYGLAIQGGYLYVGEPESIKRFKYDTRTQTVSGGGEEIVSLKGLGTGHWTRSLLFSRDGKKLFLGCGSASNVDAGEDPRRAAISTYNPDGAGWEIYASGARNPIGLHWYPNTDTLWAAVQERDGLGDNLVPDYFTHIQKGGFYGWPYAYAGHHEDPRRKGERPDLVAKAIEGDVQLGSHVAVMDFAFYTGKMFPAEYQGGAFLALHGSWNRSKRVGQSIAFVPFQGGKPSGPVKEIVTGWMLGPDRREVWGRPVGVLQLPDGSLLISEDGNNTVWRLSYR